MSDTNDESVEAPKKGKTPAQMENVKKARAKKAELDEARLAEKERLKAEARFDKLLELFDKVRVESPEPEPPKKAPTRRKAKPKPEPVEEEPYEEEEDAGVQKPKVRVKADPITKTINLRFC